MKNECIPWSQEFYHLFTLCYLHLTATMAKHWSTQSQSILSTLRSVSSSTGSKTDRHHKYFTHNRVCAFDFLFLCACLHLWNLEGWINIGQWGRQLAFQFPILSVKGCGWCHSSVVLSLKDVSSSSSSYQDQKVGEG